MGSILAPSGLVIGIIAMFSPAVAKQLAPTHPRRPAPGRNPTLTSALVQIVLSMLTSRDGKQVRKEASELPLGSSWTARTR